MKTSRSSGFVVAILLAIAASWLSKLLFAFWVPAGLPESIILAILILICNAATVLLVAFSVRKYVGEPRLKRGKYILWFSLQGALIVSLILSIAHVLPFLPDAIALAARESSHKSFLPFFLLVGIFSACVGALTLGRVPVAFLSSLWVRFSWVGIFSSIFMSLLWNVFDLCWLFAFPLFYWGALPPPVPIVPRVATELLGSERDERERMTRVVLVNPSVNDSEREMIFLKNEEGQRQFADGLAHAWQSRRRLPLRPGDSLLFVLPETTLFLEPSGLRSVFLTLRDQLAGNLPGVTVNVLLGSQYGALNAVLWAGEQPATKWPIAGVVKVKETSGRVPFFERPTLGVAVRSDAEEEMQSVAFDDWIPEDEVSSLPAFLLPKSQLICYEALDPGRWKLFSPRVVLTNHNLFAKYRLSSVTYDANLRLLASLFAAPLVLVGNEGETGVHAWKPQKFLRSDSKRRVEVEVLEFDSE